MISIFQAGKWRLGELALFTPGHMAGEGFPPQLCGQWDQGDFGGGGRWQTRGKQDFS